MAMKFYYMKNDPGAPATGKEMEFRDIIPHFCKQSTIHGLQHVGRTAGYIKFTAWLVLVLGCTAGVIYNTYAITSSYLDYLVYVKIDVQDSKEMHFPAVTLCNTNPIKKSALHHSPRMEALIASWQLDGGHNKRRRKRATCPNAVEPVSGVCFWREETGRISFAAAKQHCEDIGASLAVVDTPEKFTHIFQTPLQLAQEKSVWLDLTYSDVTGTWQWAESVDLGWSNWENNPGTPPADSDKTCVYVSYETAQESWRNVQCDGVHSFFSVYGLRPLCMDGSGGSSETTTQAETTTVPETTAHITTTLQPTTQTTTVAETTTVPITTTLQPTTQTTTVAETTTVPITTTLQPTTQTTTAAETTTVPITTTLQPTTAEVTTTASQTTTAPITTTLKETTVIDTTTFHITTTDIPTTWEDTTHLETTTYHITTSDVTTPEPTTTEPTVRDITTTGDQTTTENSITTEEDTTFPQTTSHLVVNSDGEVLREDFLREGDVMQTLSEIPDEEKQAMGYKYPDMILECSFNGRSCSVWDFDKFFDAVHGNCYVFNSGWNQSQDLFTATLSGQQRGLHLLINVGQEEYITSIGNEAGAVTVVHDQSRMPFPEDEGIMAIPGHVTSVGIRKVSVERLGQEYSSCLTDLDAIEHTIYSQLYGVNYTVSACEKTCYQTHVINTCACSDPQYPTTGDATQIPACDVRNKTQGDCVNRLTLLYIEDQLNCNCPLPCNAIMYTYKTSKTMWPSDVELDSIIREYGDQIALPSDTANMEEVVRRNLLRVEVYLEELNYETMTEVPKYPFARYISGLGAIIGLWLGCSVLSLLEILEMAIDTLYLCCTKLPTHSKAKHSNDHSIIVSPKVRKTVSPCVLSSMEIEPDENGSTSQSSTSVYQNPAFLGPPTRGRRIRSRRRSTLDIIFSVARPNAGNLYEINRLIPHGRDEGYSSEEGSPIPGATVITNHVAELHPIPSIIHPDSAESGSENATTTSSPDTRTRHERFLFGTS